MSQGALRDRALVEATREVVLAHRAGSDRERRSRERILEELAQLPRPFDEQASPTHVTGSAIIVGRRGTVLHLHRRLRIWIQPGGHIDPGEAPSEAALRESREETGLRLAHPTASPQLVHLDVHRGGRGHVHLDLRYLLEAEDGEPEPAPRESPEVRWFFWDEALAVADAGLRDGLVRAREIVGRR